MKQLGRTLIIALLVGAGSMVSAISALPESLQAAETVSAANKRQERIQEVAETSVLTVRQHHVNSKDRQGKELYTGKYLELSAKPGISHELHRAISAWNDAESVRWSHDEKMLRDAVQFVAENGITMYAPYYAGHVIADYGRADDEVMSLCVRDEYYMGGAHPHHSYWGWNLDLRTGKQLALHDVVTSRRAYLTAAAKAFRAQYPGREDQTFERAIGREMESVTPLLDWDRNIVWIMLPEGGIRVYYSVYELAPYAAGDFILTLTPEENPRLFTAR